MTKPTLSSVVHSWSAFHEVEKFEMHKGGKKAMKALAVALGLKVGEFDVRSNLAGPAVSGEVTLHSDHWYVQLSAGWKSAEVLFRLCNGRKDYRGFQNNHAPVEALETPEVFAGRLVGLLGYASAKSGPMRGERFEISDAELTRFTGSSRVVA